MNLQEIYLMFLVKLFGWLAVIALFIYTIVWLMWKIYGLTKNAKELHQYVKENAAHIAAWKRMKCGAQEESDDG